MSLFDKLYNYYNGAMWLLGVLIVTCLVLLVLTFTNTLEWGLVGKILLSIAIVGTGAMMFKLYTVRNKTVETVIAANDPAYLLYSNALGNERGPYSGVPYNGGAPAPMTPEQQAIMDAFILENEQEATKITEQALAREANRPYADGDVSRRDTTRPRLDRPPAVRIY